MPVIIKQVIKMMHDNDDDPVGSFLNALQKTDVQIRKKKKTYDRTSRRTGVEINS